MSDLAIQKSVSIKSLAHGAIVNWRREWLVLSQG